MISPKTVRLVTETDRRMFHNNPQKITFNSLKKSKQKLYSRGPNSPVTPFASPKIKKNYLKTQRSSKEQYNLFTNILNSKSKNKDKENRAKVDSNFIKKATNFFQKDCKFNNQYMLKPPGRERKETNRTKGNKKSVQKYFEGTPLIKSKKNSSKNFMPLLNSPDNFRISFEPVNKSGQSISFNMMPFL